MSDGYVRQSTGDIVDGNTIQAAPINAEFNAIQNAFSQTGGHVHDGTVGGGAKLPPTSLTGVSGNGIIVRVDATTFAARTLVPPAAGITITNPAGTAGNPTVALANDLAALEALSANGYAVRTGTDTWAQRAVTTSGNGLSVTNPSGQLGDTTIAVADDLAALEALNTNGYPSRIGADTWTMRAIVSGGNGIAVTNPSGTAGDTSIAPADDLAALEALASVGIAVRTASNTWEQRQIIAPAAGITITNPAGTAGNPTLVLANDLAALEGLGSTGIAVRTGADTWAQRQIAGTANEITLTNGDGSGGNPTASLPAALTFTGKTVTGGTLTGNTLANVTLSGSTGNIPVTATYTPTLTNTTNVSSSTASQLFYQRVGNWVNVTGRVSITATAANSNTILGMTIPIASDFTSPEQAGGTFMSATATHVRCGVINADLTNDRLTFQVYAESTSSTNYYFTVSYRIL